MTYRDELEALRAKNQRLEEELAHQRADHPAEEPPRAKDHPIERAPPPPPPRQERPDYARTRPREPGIRDKLASGCATWVVFGVCAVPLALSAYGAWAQQNYEKSLTHTAEATWPAQVKRAEGLYLPSNASCTLSGTFRSDGSSKSDASLVVRCGALTLFERKLRDRSQDPSRYCDITEEGATPRRRFQLRCISPEARYKGTVTSPALYLDTAANRFELRSSAPPLYLDLTLAPLSDPSPSAPLWDAVK